MSTSWFLPDLSLHPEGCPCNWCAAPARERGRVAAELEITAQVRREAAARAEITREMAGYGACPYRTAREAAQEFLDSAVRGRGKQLRDPKHAISEKTETVHEPALTPEQEIRAALTAFDDWMLNGPDLPGWIARDDPEPGRCRECRLGHADVPGGLCLYCKLAQQVTRKALREPERRSLRQRVDAHAILLLVISLGCWLAVALLVAGALG